MDSGIRSDEEETMTIQEYIDKQYNGNQLWFIEEINQKNHAGRIAGVIANRDYLAGRHKVLLRENSQYKGKVLETRKTILNYAKTVIRFHNTYILGKPVTLSGNDENTVNTFNDIYELGQYDTVDYDIIDRVNKFGDAYEVVYFDNGLIKSKVLDSACCYPVYDDMGEYLAFIEHWTDVFTSISYWNVYYGDYVEKWSNEGGNEHLIVKNTSVGLPIHYHNNNDEDYNFGVSMLYDIKPIMDDLEDIMSKLGDAVYVNSLNPLPVALGQRIESTIPADATGYVLNLDNGDFKYVSCTIDYNTVKVYLDNLKQMLNDISCIPSVLGSNASIANISEVAMKLLFHMASINQMETEKWLNIGFRERFNRFRRILGLQGIDANENVNVIYNVSMPVATTEMIANLQALREMGAISIESVMEKSDIVSDVDVEKQRLKNDIVKMDAEKDSDKADERKDDENADKQRD